MKTERITIDTEDGDFLITDVCENRESSPVAILFHGLEGDSKRYYITRLASHLHQRGFTTVAVNFRSCGGILNRNRRFYHSGETEDPMQVIKWASEQFPGSNLFAAGFSLGGSALLNFLKRYGDDQPLTAAAAISVPFDLKRGSLNLENGFNRVYSLRFLRTLEEKLRNKRERFPDLPSFTGSTLYDFDDQVTGPVHGFEGADDYYQQCSSAFFMNQIATKTLIVHSMQDPMCPYQWVPIDEIRKNPNLTPAFTEEGGHVGFWSLPPGWLNKSIGDYFSGYLRNRSAQ